MGMNVNQPILPRRVDFVTLDRIHSSKCILRFPSKCYFSFISFS